MSGHVELIYDHIHQRGLCTRSLFAARFEAPVLLYRREVSAGDFAGRTLPQDDAQRPRRLARALETKQLQRRLRLEAHDFRLVRLPLRGRISIGRTMDNDVPLLLRSVSQHHLLLDCHGELVVVTDVGSKNGSFVEDRRLTPHTPVELGVGQVLCVGPVPMRLMNGWELFDALDVLPGTPPVRRARAPD